MGQAIGEFLPLAVGVAISPIPIIAVILMLFSDRARANSLAFLIGWVVGISVVMAILIAVASTQDLSMGKQPSDLASWSKLVLGLLLLIAAVRGWRHRPATGTEAELPGWMRKIDSMRPAAAFGLAILLSAVNPKNLLLLAAGAGVIAQADLGTTDSVVAVAVFTLIAASSVAIPTLAQLLLGAKAQPGLDRAKVWLSVNNATVMSVLLAILGVSLLGKGLGALL